MHVLLTGAPQVSVQGMPVGPDGLSTGAQVTTTVGCTSALDGTDRAVAEVTESDSYSEDPSRGLALGEVNARCDRARATRIAWAVEVGLGGLLLLAAATHVLRRRRIALSRRSAGPDAGS